MVKKEIKEKKRVYSSWQTRHKIKKLSEFKLTKEEKELIKSNETEIKQIVMNNIDNKIKEYENEILSTKEKIKNTKKEDEKNKLKKHKKYIVKKLMAIKSASKSDAALSAKIKKLNLRKEKLKKTKKKVEEKLGILKNSLKRCLKCKKRGHLAENCPFKDEDTENDKTHNICYNCGSHDHSLYQCDKPVDYSNLQFALCFKCKKRGHISANCPLNENGIYFKGGACYVCGKKDHLAKNCPEKQVNVE